MDQPLSTPKPPRLLWWLSLSWLATVPFFIFMALGFIMLDLVGHPYDPYPSFNAVIVAAGFLTSAIIDFIYCEGLRKLKKWIPSMTNIVFCLFALLHVGLFIYEFLVHGFITAVADFLGSLWVLGIGLALVWYINQKKSFFQN